MPSAYEDGVGQLAAGALHNGRVVILHEDRGGQEGQQDSCNNFDFRDICPKENNVRLLKDSESFKILGCYKIFSPFLLDCYWECQFVSN